MNTITEALRQAMLTRELDQGSSMTWNGATFPCAGGAQFATAILGPGGFAMDNDVTIAIRKELFADQTPDKGHRITYTSTEAAAGVALKVDNVTAVLGAVLILACNHIAKGA